MSSAVRGSTFCSAETLSDPDPLQIPTQAIGPQVLLHGFGQADAFSIFLPKIRSGGCSFELKIAPGDFSGLAYAFKIAGTIDFALDKRNRSRLSLSRSAYVPVEPGQ